LYMVADSPAARLDHQLKAITAWGR